MMKRICTSGQGGILGAQDAKLEAKVRARTEPYKYANTTISVDFGGVNRVTRTTSPSRMSMVTWQT